MTPRKSTTTTALTGTWVALGPAGPVSAAPYPAASQNSAVETEIPNGTSSLNALASGLKNGRRRLMMRGSDGNHPGMGSDGRRHVGQMSMGVKLASTYFR